jgi:hypothetical protein
METETVCAIAVLGVILFVCWRLYKDAKKREFIEDVE